MGVVRHSALVDFEALENDPSPERRSELLEQVTSLVEMVSDGCPAALLAAYDTVLLRLADIASPDDRRRLALRLASLDRAPYGMVRQLAMDAIDIAARLLSRSRALSDHDLIGIAQLCGDRHRQVIASRPRIGTSVSFVLMTRGSDAVRRALAANSTAAFDRETLNRLVVQAAVDPEVWASLARHPSLTVRARAALGHIASLAPIVPRGLFGLSRA